MKVWDAETGQELLTLKLDLGNVTHVHVTSVAVSPDGKHIVSGISDKTVKVWDVETGWEVRTLEGHTGSVNSVAVSPDGKHIVSGSGDYFISPSKPGDIKVWDAEKGQEAITPELVRAVPPSAPEPQAAALSLEELKAASVYIEAESTDTAASGSGFVVRIEGDTAYVVTNHHVVTPQREVVGLAPLLPFVIVRPAGGSTPSRLSSAVARRRHKRCRLCLLATRRRTTWRC